MSQTQPIDILDNYGNVSYLFSRRLNFLGSEEYIISQIKQFPIKEDAFIDKNILESDPCNINISTTKDLQKIYELFYSLIHNCRFNRKNVDEIYNSSKEEIRKRRNLKDIQDQRKVKTKKSLQLMGFPEKDFQHWRQVLNHKNMIKHILKVRVFLKAILEANFQLIEQGSAHLKNSQIEVDLKIKLCVLVMDINSLLNTMKFMFLPFNQTESLVSKLVQEETALMEQAFEKYNQNGSFNTVNSLTNTMFFETIKLLSNVNIAQNNILKLWLKIQQIRQVYLVQPNGLVRRKPIESYKKKLQAGLVKNDTIPFEINELHLEWIFIYNEYLNFFNHEQFSISLKDVFQEFRMFLNYFINQMIRKSDKPQNIEKYITQYLLLIKNIWNQLQSQFVQEMFLEQMMQINKKFKLSAQIIKEASRFIMKIINQKVELFKQRRNEQYLKKIKHLVFELSDNLLRLQADDDLIQDYFISLQKSVHILLKQRCLIEKTFQQINQCLSNLQLNDFFQTISKVQKLITRGYSKIMIIQNQWNERQIIKILYENYPEHKNLIDEIYNFLETSRCLTKTQSNEEQLLASKKFYSSKKQEVINNNMQINQLKLAQLPFGLLDLIRIMIYELALNIKLKFNSKELDKDHKFIYKLLKFYLREKDKKIKEIQEIQQEQPQNQQVDIDYQLGQMLLKKVTSHQIKFENFKVQNNQKQNDLTSNKKYHQFASKFLKKLYQMRLQIIRKNIQQLQQNEKPLEEEYIHIKNIIYTGTIKNDNKDILAEQTQQLARIEYFFIKKRHYLGWIHIKKLKKIQEIKQMLESRWCKNRNILKIYVKLFLKYQQIYFDPKLICHKDNISNDQAQNLVEQVLKTQPIIFNQTNLQENRQFVQELTKSIKVLDRLQKVQLLKRDIRERDQIMKSLEQAKTYDLFQEKNKYTLTDGKLKVYRFQKLGNVMMRKYIINCPNNSAKRTQKKLKMLTKLNLNNITIQMKQVGKIQMIVDEVQTQFSSYPKLVKYLIQTYARIIKFCRENLNFQLYPLLRQNDFKIIQNNDQQYFLRINPYEGILLNILLQYEQLKKSGIYNFPRNPTLQFPKHPFILFSNQLKEKVISDKKYNEEKVVSTEQHGFWNLIQEMKAISLQINHQELQETVDRILKCPYFWSITQKLFEIVQFKERYHSMVNIQESRRKANQRVRQSLDEQEQKQFTYQPPHPQYKKSYGYNKTAQMYFSIEGIVEKQAFLQDIGNFRSYGEYKKKQFRLQSYDWSFDEFSAQKKQINRLIRMISRRERRKGSRSSTFHKKSFPSFHTQIRNLRNIVSHYMYDDENKFQITLEYKLDLIEKSFPKLFVFIYRWKSFLGKDFSVLQNQKTNLLLTLFNGDKDEVIDKLNNIKQLKKYKIENQGRKKLFNLFKYDFDKKYSKYDQDNKYPCRPCNILCTLLKKKSCFWDLLSDKDDPNAKEKKQKQKDNPPYNYLFYEHSIFGCNGMEFLLPLFLNTMRRNNFTSEECAEIKSTITELRVRKQKIERKIQNLQNRGYEEDEQFSEVSSYSSDEQKYVERKETYPVEIRCQQLTTKEKQQYFQQMIQFDYVNKYSIYHLELLFPYLFSDLRKQRYQWDDDARKFDEKVKQ